MVSRLSHTGMTDRLRGKDRLSLSSAGKTRYTSTAVVLPTGLLGATLLFMACTQDLATAVDGPLATVGVSPSSASILPGQTQQFTATFLDPQGNELSGPVTWSSSNTSVATVDDAGLATGLQTGSTSIEAVLQGQGSSASLQVTAATQPPAPPSGLNVVPISSSRIDGTFVDNSNNEELFRVERDAGSGFQDYMTVAANSNGFTDTGVAPGATYSYRLRAENAAGVSAFSNTATATTPSGGGGTHPNEPAGFSKIFEVQFTNSDVPLFTGGTCQAYDGLIGGNQCIWRTSGSKPTALAPGAPPRGAYAYRYTYNAGMVAGGGPAPWFNIWNDSNNGAETAGQAFSEYYEHGYVYWDGGTDGLWEFAGVPGSVKFLGQMGVGLDNTGPQTPQNLHPPLGNIEGSAAGAHIYASPGGDQLDFFLNKFNTDAVCSLGINVPIGTVDVAVDTWHEYEFHVIANTPGVADGEMHFWWNGTKAATNTTVRWRESGCTAGFWVRRWDPTYGGGDLTTAKTTTDYMWINYVYASGRN